MKKFIIILLLIFIPSVSFAQIYTVERIIDGDTLRLTTGEEVQLIGVDAPESKPNEKVQRDSQRIGKSVEAINNMGLEATQFARWLVFEGKKVRLEFDVQEKDKYDRLLAYVYVNASCLKNSIQYLVIHNEIETMDVMPGHPPVHEQEIFLNKEIIKWGYATPMTIPPNVKHADLFQKVY